jgi:hypothetical protein
MRYFSSVSFISWSVEKTPAPGGPLPIPYPTIER